MELIDFRKRIQPEITTAQERVQNRVMRKLATAAASGSIRR